MNHLEHKHLITLELDVDFKAMQLIGKTPSGLRTIAPISSGVFSGKRMNGTVLPGADWVLNRQDHVMLIDVRLVLQTSDSVNIYLNYQGRFLAQEDAMKRFSNGELLAPSEYSLVISARFECGDHNYNWLNNIVAVGTGEQTKNGPIYEIFEIG